MKKITSVGAVVVCLSCSGLFAQPSGGPTLTTNPPLRATPQSPPSSGTNLSQPLSSQRPLAQPLPASSPASQIAGASQPVIDHMIFKDAIEANNKTVDRVAGIFQGFGWWIGILASIVSLGAGVVGWFAFKSLRDFNDEYRRRIAKAEKDWRDEWTEFQQKATTTLEGILNKARTQVDEAEASARRAGRYEAEIQSTKAVLDRALTELDETRAKILAQLQAGGSQGAKPPVTPAKTETTIEKTETLSAEDNAEVKEKLRGKITNGDKTS
jgi:hypothetical protein